MLLQSAKHSVRHGTKPGRCRTSHTHAEAPYVHLCSAQITHKWYLPPTHSLQHISFPGKCFLGYHICVSSGSAFSRLADKMRLNIHWWKGIFILCKRWIGDKFKSFLCHDYRKVLQSLIMSIENSKRYRSYSKIGCLLERMRPSLWMPPPGPAAWLEILQDSHKGAILFPFLQCIRIMALSAESLLLTEQQYLQSLQKSFSPSLADLTVSWGFTYIQRLFSHFVWTTEALNVSFLPSSERLFNTTPFISFGHTLFSKCYWHRAVVLLTSVLPVMPYWLIWSKHDKSISIQLGYAWRINLLHFRL